MVLSQDFFDDIEQRKQRWKWLFLDLDNTLWDFDANAKEALKELYRRHSLHLHCDWKVEAFVDLYQDINAAYWRRYERGEVNKETLRTARFTDTFTQMGIPAAIQPKNIWQEYLEICPVMTITMPGALAAIKQLSTKYKIGLLTNGFQATQTVKIQSNGFDPYISFMQTSEQMGIAKPAADFFKEALGTAGISSEQALYMGDNWHTDVEGGCNAGLSTFWYQTEHNRSVSQVTEFQRNPGLITDAFWSWDSEVSLDNKSIPSNYLGRIHDWEGFTTWLLS